LHLKRVILMARWRGYARRMKKYRIELWKHRVMNYTKNDRSSSVGPV
jgi:hypothetical protein